jgi:hypothetical protein
MLVNDSLPDFLGPRLGEPGVGAVEVHGRHPLMKIPVLAPGPASR